jgi:hypothetical protein
LLWQRWQLLPVQMELLLFAVHVLLRHCVLLHLLLHKASRLLAAVGRNPCSTCTQVCYYMYKAGASTAVHCHAMLAAALAGEEALQVKFTCSGTRYT